LRRELAPVPVRASLLMVFALGSWLLLLVWQTRDVKLAAWVFAGTLGTLALLAAGAALLLRLLRPLRGRVGVAWRYGLASVLRRGRQSIAQTVAFGLGIMVLLLLTVIRGQLIESWRASLPTDAPNQFLINIQPDDRSQVEQFFQAHDLAPPKLYPMVRGRLLALDGKPLDTSKLPPGRARHLADREANLSWAQDLQRGNRIVAGRWWHGDREQTQVSLEEAWAKTLGIKLGDTLTFRIAGQTLTATVTSLRKVDWDSFLPNFFLVLRPGSLEGFPATYITAVHLPRQQAPLMLELVRKVPSITPIDVEALITQVRDVMNQATLAVEYVFGFTLAAGLLVLLAAVQASRDERRFEAALLRTLGASRRTVLAGLVAEFSVLGLLAGALGAIAAGGAGWLLAGHVFNLPYRPGLWVLLSGSIAGTVLVGISGVAATWSVVRQPPVETLRRGT
jgi:putative ABC transport system permease protein